MRGSKENGERQEQVRKDKRRSAKVEPLRPQAKQPDKFYNDLAKFPSENPYPVLRIHKNGTVLYANKASEELLKARSSGMGQPAPAEWHRLVKKTLSSGQVIREETEHNGRVFAFRAVPIADSDYANFYGVDITDQKKAEEEREIMIGLLRLINATNQTKELMKLVMVFLKDVSGCEAVGIRLQEGEDFPYFVSSGFTEEFIRAENKLCSVNEMGELVRDSQGRPFLECMCGNIISGRFDPSRPFFTKHGSFWTNSTTNLLAGTTDADRLAKTRNRCNTAGYESVALVPLRAGDQTFGLLQFNSKQKDRFTPERISLFERLADNLGIGLAQRRADEAMRESEEKFKTLAEEAFDSIVIHEGGRIVEANKTFGKKWGYKPEETVGLKVDKLIAPESLEMVKEKIRCGYDKPYEAVAVSKNGKRFPVEIVGKPMTYKGGMVRIATARDITERKKAEEKVKAERQRLYDVLETLPVMVCLLTPDYHVAFSNRVFRQKFGEDNGRHCYDFIFGRKGPCEFCEAYNVLKTGKPHHWERTGPDGFSIIDIYDFPFTDTDGTPLILEMDIDITERKRAEENLKAREEFLDNIIEQTPNSIWISDEHGTVIRMNQAIRELLELTNEEIIGKYNVLKDVQVIEQGFLPLVKSVFEKGKTVNFVIDYYTEKERQVELTHKTHKVLDIVISAIKNKDGKVVNAICQHKDITERKLAEEALKKSNQLLRDTGEMAKVGGWELDLSTREVFCTEETCRIHGLEPGHKLSLEEALNFYAPESRPDVEAVLKKAAETGEPYDLESLFIPSGSKDKIWVRSLGRAIYSGGKIVKLAGTFQNIDKYKRAEEALRKSEEHYRMLADTMNDGLGEIDESGRFVYLNRKLGEILGFSSDEMIGRHWSEFYDRDAQEIIKAQLIARREGLSEPYEFTTTRKDGRKIHIRVSPQAIFDAHGKFKGSLAIFTDITRRKLTEEQLQEERNLLRTLIDHIPDKVYVKDKDSRFVVCNKAVIEYEGKKSKDDVIGKTDFDLYEPAEAQIFFDEEQKVMRTGQPLINREGQYSDKAGNALYILTTKVPLQDSRGNVIGIVGTGRDITERKKTEEALLKSERKMHAIFDQTFQFIGLMTIDGILIEANRTALEFGDIEASSVLNKPFWQGPWWAHSPELQEKLRQAVGKAARGEFVRFEATHVAKDGMLHYVDFSLKPVKDETGKVIFLIPEGRDVTERKQAEHKLLEYQKQLKRLAAQLSLAEERERRRIAGELHDQVTQSLALAKIKLDSLRAAAVPQPLAQVFADISGSLEKAIQDTRSLTFDLSYPILYEIGFEAAVAEWLNEQVRDKHGIGTEFQDDGQSKPLDDDVRMLLFRNVRELLINVIKHSRASKVKVCIRRVDDSIEVTVKDNGAGFDPAKAKAIAAKTAKFGLFSIRESVEQLGGRFEIESKPDAGCTATMIVPLKRKGIDDERNKATHQGNGN
jgi:PAS domain S-box-containing protein